MSPPQGFFLKKKRESVRAGQRRREGNFNVVGAWHLLFLVVLFFFSLNVFFVYQNDSNLRVDAIRRREESFFFLRGGVVDLVL